MSKIECPWCQGSGRQHHDRCIKCGGDGMVEPKGLGFTVSDRSNAEKIVSRGTSIQCDLVGSYGVYNDPLAETKVECRVRSIHYKPVMKIGQLLEMEGPFLLVQDENGELLEVHFSDFQIVE